ncbi:MAG: hypothetical protein COV10_01125 [Candidatus Vogelbacteria bacterium CG10_big_fil_rev_8_21_14_0_10_51_16]|uniref:Uncharacterized protein n=1 Tax=Candidatus Vogelbacteria bacterium CG10_big_fil_rev_8_21_14_0_10_51_16 TaxID=1975045 RepID=A0A2H0RFA1_9BACT|nr:MAG: hypothetical protein COV10_01125 [Candidatus Vogelbacteria bacterium CG10_big_fil_rev_8_21_14_0_10_51_16]
MEQETHSNKELVFSVTPSGVVSHPYRLVFAWVGVLVLVGVGFWYFTLFDGNSPFARKATPDMVINTDGSPLNAEEMAAIMRASSAKPDTPPALSRQELEQIVFASSVEANAPPALSEAEALKIIKASSL